MTNRRRVVVALGGNAFVEEGQKLTMAGQFRFAREALATLAPLFEPDVALAIVHGNGPQVGSMLVRVEESLGKAYALPLEVCVAESEGELGYVLAQSLRNVLSDRGAQRPVASILTQVLVDENDPAFLRPTKPIGPFYDASQADELRARGFTIVEDSGRGYRRVVPSPAPHAIIEADIVGVLLEAGAIVIAAGGGGVPVIRRGERLQGVDAVIDKDLTAALLAEAIGAETLLILTAVSNVYLRYRRPDQEALRRLTPLRARELLAEGHFGEGSMAPKIDAAARFAERTGRRAAITCPAFAEAALAGEAGTLIQPG
ncbi:MAG: carbamate kinase [Polyangiaceae bacterium]|nr:carbamate kinase [Polyangiaceae bacterium]